MGLIKYGSGYEGQATKLHAFLVVVAVGVCQCCGEHKKSLQCAHIIPRSKKPTRTVLANAWCLCAGCHRRLPNYPYEYVGLIERTIGREKYEKLLTRANSRVKVDWKEEFFRLDGIAKRKNIEHDFGFKADKAARTPGRKQLKQSAVAASVKFKRRRKK